MRELLARAPVRIGVFLAGLVLALLAGYGLGSLVADEDDPPAPPPPPTHVPGHDGAAGMVEEEQQ
jgi:hypothetical protein